MPDINPSYRNQRKNFYSDKGPDSLAIGSIINTFKVKSASNSYDSQFSAIGTPINNTAKYFDVLQNSFPEDNPDYQYNGYLYCDGSEYYIKDYPVLFSVIGNEYGGAASSGIRVLSGGSGYTGTPTVTFSSAPTGGTTAIGALVHSSGIVTGISLNNPGAGYVTAPTITLSNTGGGSGATFAVRISSQGVISDITQSNVFEFWPEETMGTFYVPDLKAKKIVGRGQVYGAGSPLIANAEIIVGKNGIGGKWYLDKNAQKQQFNLGSVKTIGYDKVTDNIGANVIGAQTITVKLNEQRMSGPPQHNHFLLHSEAPAVFGGPGSGVYDTYVQGYKNTNGRVAQFSPSGGLTLTHAHGLLRKPNTNTGVASYDVFNYTGGDINLGSVNSAGNYLASGNSGVFVLITDTPDPTFKKFISTSLIGGRLIVTEGTPIYAFAETNYTSAGTYTYSIPANIDELLVTLYGGGGSGGVYNLDGNDGGNSTVVFGNSLATVIAGGGKKGNAASSTAGGTGGAGGTISTTGNTTNISTGGNVNGAAGGTGGNGVYWKTVTPTAPTAVGIGGGNGSNGLNLTVNEQVDQSAVTYTYPTSGNFTAVASSTNYSLAHVKFELYGSIGRDCGNFGGLYGCTTGRAGAGKFLRIKQLGTSPGGVFGIYPGQSGRVYAGIAAQTYGNASGGPGGDGYSDNDGGGGGAGSIITGTIGSTVQILAGAAGGGGGGGAGEGQCGDNATGNALNDGVQQITAVLFSGGGGAGGNYGCTGGGGGGGGGGVGLSSQTGTNQGGNDGAGGSGGSGGGGGGSGGHGGGYGGARGLSSIRSDIFELEASGDSTATEGRIVALVREDRSYYTSFAGGGGGGAVVDASMNAAQLATTGISSLTITVGAGGAGRNHNIANSNTGSSSAGGIGIAQLQAATITGYAGGTESISIGDIVESGSNGVDIYVTGTGSGTAGGFKLPTTQVPTVEITPQGTGTGSGATATAVITSGAVSAVNLSAGGSGYAAAPKIRFLHGAGAGTKARTTLTGGGVSGITLTASSSTSYTHYVKIGGAELTRFIVIKPFDCTNVNRIGVKAARGNNINGGETPDDSADELRVYYNDDGSTNFPDANFVGVIVSRPTDAEIASNYDGSGSGTEATKWYTYRLDIPEGAQAPGVKFKIVQNRTTASGGNDNGGNTDQYGICEFFYDYKLVSETQFVATPGEIPSSAGELSYTVEGPGNAPYSAGISANDVKFTMSSSVPILPTPFLDPKINIPLAEPYMLTKYLIKAY